MLNPSPKKRIKPIFVVIVLLFIVVPVLFSLSQKPNTISDEFSNNLDKKPSENIFNTLEIENFSTEAILELSESENIKFIEVTPKSVKAIEGLPLNKRAFRLSSFDYYFFRDYRNSGSDTLKILISGDVKKVNGYSVLPAVAYQNIFTRKIYRHIEYGLICPEYFDLIALLYDDDGEYVTSSQCTIYTDQDHFSHIEMKFNNVVEGNYYVAFIG